MSFLMGNWARLYQVKKGIILAYKLVIPIRGESYFSKFPS